MEAAEPYMVKGLVHSGYLDSGLREDLSDEDGPMPNGLGFFSQGRYWRGDSGSTVVEEMEVQEEEPSSSRKPEGCVLLC